MHPENTGSLGQVPLSKPISQFSNALPIAQAFVLLFHFNIQQIIQNNNLKQPPSNFLDTPLSRRVVSVLAPHPRRVLAIVTSLHIIGHTTRAKSWAS